MENRSLIAYNHWINSKEKFDYFILGIISALFAYLSQNIIFVKFDFNSPTFELFSLILAFLSGLFAYFFIKYQLDSIFLNYEKLYLLEIKGENTYNLGTSDSENYINRNNGEIKNRTHLEKSIKNADLKVPQIDSRMNIIKKRALIFHKLRNYSLILTALLLIISKII